MASVQSSSPPPMQAQRLLGADQPSTSPRSDSVEKALARHRKALEEIRNSNLEVVPINLNFNQDSKPSRVVFHEPENAQMDCRKKDSSAKQAALRDLLTWKNPAASVFAIIAGSFIYAFLRNGSITTLVCYALLSRVGWHVVCTIFSKQAGANTRLRGSSFVENWSVTTACVVRLLAEFHDDYIVTADTRRSVTVSTALWFLSLVARRMDMLTLVYVAYLSAFLLPNVHDGHVTAIVGELTLRVKHSTPSVFTQMNTKQRRLSIAAIAASLWLVFDWPNRLVGLLMAVLCIRMTMTQVEVDNLREMGAPLTVSVKKKAARMSRRVSMYLGTADKTRLR